MRVILYSVGYPIPAKYIGQHCVSESRLFSNQPNQIKISFSLFLTVCLRARAQNKYIEYQNFEAIYLNYKISYLT